MDLSNLVFAAIVLMVLGGVIISGIVGVQAYLRFRGQRVVTCPETQRPAAVHVNALKVAGQAFLGKEWIRLDQCSRWPEKKNCGQDCLREVHADPTQCLVWNMVADWYKGKSCAYCHKPFVAMRWHQHHAALLSPTRVATQWNEVAPEKLPEVFQTYLPVCWDCYIAETFRTQNPGRAVDRTWQRGAGGEYIPKETEEPAIRKPTGTEG